MTALRSRAPRRSALERLRSFRRASRSEAPLGSRRSATRRSVRSRPAVRRRVRRGRVRRPAASAAAGPRVRRRARSRLQLQVDVQRTLKVGPIGRASSIARAVRKPLSTRAIIPRSSGEFSASRCSAKIAPTLTSALSCPSWSTALVRRSVRCVSRARSPSGRSCRGRPARPGRRSPEASSCGSRTPR